MLVSIFPGQLSYNKNYSSSRSVIGNGQILESLGKGTEIVFDPVFHWCDGFNPGKSQPDSDLGNTESLFQSAGDRAYHHRSCTFMTVKPAAGSGCRVHDYSEFHGDRPTEVLRLIDLPARKDRI